jgi:L,D-peptidoglycan transpeptidase YkuD (ErfK/YbiS/YcfS/YnhG family)
MELTVAGDGLAWWNGRRFRCALGRAGITKKKREGDGASPAGSFLMRRVLYRPDRIAAPSTRLPLAAIAPQDGWCDDPADAKYNLPVRLPYPARAEKLWREDRLYDLVVPLGYNDDPVRPGLGSAIFLHLASENYGPTEGCIALNGADLLSVLQEADETSRVVIGG